MATALTFYMKRVSQVASAVSNVMFGKHLLITNATFSTAMGITGDLVQQYYEILTDRQDKWQPIRTLHMGAAGLTTGILCHYWYGFLDIYIPGKTFRTVLKKVLYDQILFSPVSISTYFGTIAVLEGSLKQLKAEIFQKGSKIYTAEWIIWPPVQFINFYLLPLKYRVIFDNCVSFGFDIYSPYIKYRCKLKNQDEINDKN